MTDPTTAPPEPRRIRQADVVRLHRPSGELRFRDPDPDDPVQLGQVVQLAGVGFTVSRVEGDGERRVLTAYPSQMEALGDVEPWVLRLQPGDVVVITSRTALSADQHQQIVDAVKLLLPGFQVLVLDENLRIGRIRTPQDDPGPVEPPVAP